MAQNLLLALQITAIGMGLVFGSIILFWLLMAAMMRVTNAGHPRGEGHPHGDAPTGPGAEGESRQGDLQEGAPSENALLKRRAAAAAVAVALARRSGAAGLPSRPASPPAQTSAWQVVQRAKSLRIFPRGPAR